MTEYIDPITHRHIEQGLVALRQEFAGIFSVETIERYVAESVADLSSARVKNCLPLFVNRFCRERLRARAQDYE